MSNLYFIDTNILIKYYRDENGTEQVRELVQKHQIYFSNWTIVEYVDELRKRLFIQNLDKNEQYNRRKEFEVLFEKLKWDIIDKIFNLHILPTNFHKRATDLIHDFGAKKQMGMKRNDALQIVAYEEFLKLQPETIFVTHDAPLKNVLDELKLKYLDPVLVSS
ncbi:MAG: type II toxin-antitoxin system VapC family toxin [Leptospiraceae bacterium]|nr:type II toxin-antitoxin system VapC family toxin [Leptospiraceae bacterium]